MQRLVRRASYPKDRDALIPAVRAMDPQITGKLMRHIATLRSELMAAHRTGVERVH
jgi:hypothetical protein